MSTTPPSPTPQGQPQHTGTDTVEFAVAAALVVILLALALPVLLVAAATWSALRHASRRAKLIVLGTGAVAAGVVALGPGYHSVLHRYWRAVAATARLVREPHPHVLAAVATWPNVLWAAAPLGVIAGAAWSLRGHHHQRAAQPGQQSGAPRALPRQLRPLVLARPAGDRPVLGKLDGRLVAAPVERHVAVIAPTRSGKTRGLVIPVILEWKGPVVATSVKSDLLYDPMYGSGAYAWRAKDGRPVWVFDPSGSSGWPSMQWSPLGRAETWQGALRAAHAMVTAEKGGGDNDNGTARFFSARAMSVLAPVLHAVALSDGSMSDVLNLVRGATDLQDLADDLEEGLSTMGASPEAVSAVGALRSGSETSSGDVLATIANVLAPWDDPKVVAATDECEFSPAELIETGGTLFIVAGPDSQRLAPLFAALLDELLAYVAAKALRDGALSPRLLLALDEVANIAPIEKLPSLLATLGGQGVTVLTAWQSLGQMKRWGPSGPSEILGNSACQIWAPSDDPETAEHLSRSLGKKVVAVQSVSHDAKSGLFSPGWGQQRSVSISETERSVLDPSMMREMTGPLLVAQGLPPTQVEWRFYDRDRTLCQRASMPLPEPEDEPDAPILESMASDFAPSFEDEESGPGDDDEDDDLDDVEPGVVVPGPSDWWTEDAK